MPTNKVAKDDTLQSLVSAVEDIADLMGDGVINDSSTAADKTWSAQKINSVKTTADNAFPRSEQAVLGAVNICIPTADGSGIITKNADNTYTVNGTLAAAQVFEIGRDALPILEIGKQYKVVGCPSIKPTGTGLTIRARSNAQIALTETGSGAIWDASDATKADVFMYIYLPAGEYDNVVFKPMVTPNLSATYDDYVKGAMTNKELTENKADITAIGTDESGHITASKAYSQNDYFYQNGELCCAKTDISNGDNLVEEGNYTKQSIGFALHGKVGAICPTFSGDCDDLSAGTVYASSSATHAPTDWCIIHTFSSGLSLTNSYMTQLAMPVNQDFIYYRKKSNGTWGSWYKFEGTVVS